MSSSKRSLVKPSILAKFLPQSFETYTQNSARSIVTHHYQLRIVRNDISVVVFATIDQRCNLWKLGDAVNSIFKNILPVRLRLRSLAQGKVLALEQIPSCSLHSGTPLRSGSQSCKPRWQKKTATWGGHVNSTRQ